MSRRPDPTLYLLFPWSTSGAKNASMCFHYTHIYTSKQSSQHSGQREFIVAVTLLLLSDIMSKHVGVSVCLFSLVSLNLEGEIMFVKCHGIRLGSEGEYFEWSLRCEACVFEMDHSACFPWRVRNSGVALVVAVAKVERFEHPSVPLWDSPDRPHIACPRPQDV